MSKNLSKVSKSMAYLLRHGAPKYDINYNEDGSIHMKDVIEWLNQTDEFKNITIGNIKQIVSEDLKGRYTIKHIEGEEYIRANQGHSFHVVPETTEITIDNVKDYDIIFHGTFSKFRNNIEQIGLKVMSRQHIHMVSLSTPEPFKLLRPEVDLFVIVDVKQALLNGIKFHISTNQVVLSEGNENNTIPPQYLTFLERVKSPCSGVLVISYDHNYKPHIAMVKTPKNNWSFPKGKKDKGEMSFQTALRELREETGIKSKDLTFEQLTPYFEHNNKTGNISVSYYVAYYPFFVEESELIPEDQDELSEARWIPVEDIINWESNDTNGHLYDKRRDIVKTLVNDVDLYKST